MTHRIVLILLLVGCSVVGANGQPSSSLKGNWEFSATSAQPSSTVDGTITILLDSATHVVAILELSGRRERLFGRHLDDRFIARTDSAQRPTVRMDLRIDSLGETLSGDLKIDRITASEAGKKPKLYPDVMFALYGKRAAPHPKIKKRHQH